MEIKIENLKYYPQYIDVVVNWLFSEWGNENFNFWDSWVRTSLNCKDIPQTYIAFVNNEIVGTYSLWRCDLQSRQDLFPWFGGLYISKKHRGREYDGVKLGVIMQKHAKRVINNLGYSEMYLFTEKNPKYYISNGWKFFGIAPDEEDKKVSLCRYCIEEEKNNERN